MSTTTHHDTEITVDPDVPLVRITREFDAPPEKVFRAHTDPALVVQWLGPRDLEGEIDTWDCRSGGDATSASTTSSPAESMLAPGVASLRSPSASASRRPAKPARLRLGASVTA
jgi:hypothetical protein